MGLSGPSPSNSAGLPRYGLRTRWSQTVPDLPDPLHRPRAPRVPLVPGSEGPRGSPRPLRFKRVGLTESGEFCAGNRSEDPSEPRSVSRKFFRYVFELVKLPLPDFSRLVSRSDVRVSPLPASLLVGTGIDLCPPFRWNGDARVPVSAFSPRTRATPRTRVVPKVSGIAPESGNSGLCSIKSPLVPSVKESRQSPSNETRRPGAAPVLPGREGEAAC
jgi:hypothetical protein